MGRAVRILPVVRIAAVVAVAIAPTTLVVASAGAAGLGRAATVAAASPTYSAGAITLSVVSSRDVSPGKDISPHAGDPVKDYQWIINADDTGNPGTAKDPLLTDCLPSTAAGAHSTDPNFADTCPWPSTRPTSGFAPIVAEGDQADFAAGKPLAPPRRQVPHLGDVPTASRSTARTSPSTGARRPSRSTSTRHRYR